MQALPRSIAEATGCSWATAAATAGHLLCVMVLVCRPDGSIPDAKRLGSRDGGEGYRHELPGGASTSWATSRELLVRAGILEADGRGYLTRVASHVWTSIVVAADCETSTSRPSWAPIRRHALRELRDTVTAGRADQAARRVFLACLLATAAPDTDLVDRNGHVTASRTDLAEALGAPLRTIKRLVTDLMDLEVITRPATRRGNRHLGQPASRASRLPSVSNLREAITGRKFRPSRAAVVVPERPTPPVPQPIPSGRAGHQDQRPSPSPCPSPGQTRRPATAKADSRFSTTKTHQPPVQPGPGTTNATYTQDARTFYTVNATIVRDAIGAVPVTSGGIRRLGPAVQIVLDSAQPLMRARDDRLSEADRDLRDHAARAARLLELAAAETSVIAQMCQLEISPEADDHSVLATAMAFAKPQLDGAREARRRRGRRKPADPGTTTFDLTNLRVGPGAPIDAARQSWSGDLARRVMAAAEGSSEFARTLRALLDEHVPRWREPRGASDVEEYLESSGTSRAWARWVNEP